LRFACAKSGSRQNPSRTEQEQLGPFAKPKRYEPVVQIRNKETKMFFFEKKNQKTFVS